ncbi:hypothetical protein ALC56_04686, partial [Trachymyrmex septentrionalis]
FYQSSIIVQGLLINDISDKKDLPNIKCIPLCFILILTKKRLHQSTTNRGPAHPTISFFYILCSIEKCHNYAVMYHAKVIKSFNCACFSTYSEYCNQIPVH